ncbi:MAG: hypothetical protein EBX47_05265 [Synechococcaceae bacterium WB8_1B_057]|nr:hypothetical protein [Synechococcaceae bacterium WB6_1A_059]NDG78826.1 hypothetical protein [Synechococcaceae bacterium WB8_1B_057]
MKNNSAKIAVAYRTLPGDSASALVIGTNGLPDSHHDALMSLIESDAGQQANELADVLATRRFPDGSVMLAYLHSNGHLTKVKTSMVIMTPNVVTTLPLDQLNELIAKDKGVSVEDLAVKEDGSAPVKKTNSVPPANSPEAKKLVEEAPYHPGYEGAVIKDEKPVTAADLRSMADKLFKEAQALRKKAEEIEPTKKKTKVANE